ncbi:4Fe-4S single cluster domain-containing protein [Cytobacillus sp. FJAT-54145]|uniref:4Fe-4S single cluster domain-containing protein n=1 Tax=Cytobacillus spartinae TaxID=3299023 RepID=A0ABW6KCH1_9BACI
MNLRIHRFLPLTTVEGPGKRACLWVQGCSIRCRGCGVPWTWSVSGGSDILVDDLFEKILESKHDNEIEGVTFLGGEPFDQAGPLALLAEKIKNTGLSIMSFSGYTYEHILEQNKPHWNKLLTHVDLLIDGPFIQAQLDLSRPWVGSSNQQYRFLTDRYKYLENNLSSIANKIEIRLERDGTIAINGMVTQENLKLLTKDMGERKFC